MARGHRSPEVPEVPEVPDHIPEPAAPTAGRDELKVTVQGTTSQDITDGAYVDLTVKLGLIRIFSNRYDLFQVLREDSTAVGSTDGSVLIVDQRKDSVIPAGNFTLTYTYKLPKETPQAKFSVFVSIWNSDEADIATLRGQLDLARYDTVRD